MQVTVVDRVIAPANGIVLFEPLLDVYLDVAIILRRHVQRLPNEGVSYFTLVDHHAARFNHRARQLEHDFFVLVWRVDCDIGVGARAQMAFIFEAQDPRRAGAGDDCDLAKRVFPI